MYGNPLNREEITRLIARDTPLIENYVSLEAQLQPNGFDLSVREVGRFTTPGQLGASDADRVISDTEPLPFDESGWLKLTAGTYLVTYNEVVNLPPDLMALGRPAPASSAAACHCTRRCGIGYSGRSQSLLTVHHPGGFRLQRDARVAQLVFFRLSSPPAEGYHGRYPSGCRGRSGQI